MKEKEQSSIEWLIEQLILKDRENNPNSFTMQIYFESHNELIKQAKKLHKNDIEDAFSESRLTHPMIGFKHNTFEEYYNEKYSK